MEEKIKKILEKTIARTRYLNWSVHEFSYSRPSKEECVNIDITLINGWVEVQLCNKTRRKTREYINYVEGCLEVLSEVLSEGLSDEEEGGLSDEEAVGLSRIYVAQDVVFDAKEIIELLKRIDNNVVDERFKSYISGSKHTWELVEYHFKYIVWLLVTSYNFSLAEANELCPEIREIMFDQELAKQYKKDCREYLDWE
jgi:hypothetical protein